MGADRVVTFPIQNGNAFDLPPVCVLSGSTDDIVWQRRTYAYYSPWCFLALLINILIFAIIVLAIQKKAKVELPFNRAALGRLRRRQWIASVIFGVKLYRESKAGRPGVRGVATFALIAPLIGIAGTVAVIAALPR